MKQWTMPKVVIDAFAANEHVAACAPYVPQNSSKWYAADFMTGEYDDSWWGGGQLRSVTDGTPDGVFQGVDYEGWVGTGRINGANVAGYAVPHRGWHTNVPVYERRSGVNYYDRMFFTEKYFTPIGTYDVFIKDGKTYFYAPGSAGQFEPSTDKLHS